MDVLAVCIYEILSTTQLVLKITMVKAKGKLPFKYKYYNFRLIVARVSARALNKRLTIQRRLAWSLSKNDTHNRGRDTPLFWIFRQEIVTPSQLKAISLHRQQVLQYRTSPLHPSAHQHPCAFHIHEPICKEILLISSSKKSWQLSCQEFTVSLCCRSGISFFRRP